MCVQSLGPRLYQVDVGRIVGGVVRYVVGLSGGGIHPSRRPDEVISEGGRVVVGGGAAVERDQGARACIITWHAKNEGSGLGHGPISTTQDIVWKALRGSDSAHQVLLGIGQLSWWVNIVPSGVQTRREGGGGGGCQS